VWDILPDMMHIIPGIWQRHILHLLVGTRTPAPVKARKKYTKEQNKELFAAHEACKKLVADWKLTKVQ
jgi:spore coat polysaccharide biosynthesis predicted glycosyltransferase SpsG